MFNWVFTDYFLVAHCGLFLLLAVIGLATKTNKLTIHSYWIMVLLALVPLLTGFLKLPWAWINMAVIIIDILLVLWGVLLWKAEKAKSSEFIALDKAWVKICGKVDVSHFEESVANLNESERTVFFLHQLENYLTYEKGIRNFFSSQYGAFIKKIPDMLREVGLEEKADALSYFLIHHEEDVLSANGKDKVSKSQFLQLDSELQGGPSYRGFDAALLSYVKEHLSEFGLNDSDVELSPKERLAWYKAVNKKEERAKRADFESKGERKYRKDWNVYTACIAVFGVLSILMHIFMPATAEEKWTTEPFFADIVEGSEFHSDRLSYKNKDFWVEGYLDANYGEEENFGYEIELLYSKNGRSPEHEAVLDQYYEEDFQHMDLKKLSTSPGYVIDYWFQPVAFVYYGIVPADVQSITFDGQEAKLTYKNVQYGENEVSFKFYSYLREMTSEEKDFYNETKHVKDAKVVVTYADGTKETVEPNVPAEDIGLYDDVDHSVTEKTEYNYDYSSLKKHLNADELTFFILSEFQYNMRNYGVIIYNGEAEESTAKHVPEELQKLGLDDMADCYEAFLKENQVNQKWHVGDTEDDVVYTDRLKINSNAFDREFATLNKNDKLYKALVQFIKDNPESFADDIP